MLPLDLVGVTALFSLDDECCADHLSGRGDVEEERFSVLGRYQCEGCCSERLELLEGLLRFSHPSELIGLF